MVVQLTYVNPTSTFTDPITSFFPSDSPCWHVKFSRSVSHECWPMESTEDHMTGLLLSSFKLANHQQAQKLLEVLLVVSETQRFSSPDGNFMRKWWWTSGWNVGNSQDFLIASLHRQRVSRSSCPCRIAVLKLLAVGAENSYGNGYMGLS